MENKKIKIILIIIGIIVLTPILISSGLDLYYKYNQNQVTIKITPDTTGEICPDDYPLVLGIKNTSNKTVSRVSFDLGIYQKGYSRDISDIFSDYDSYKILKPDESHLSCWGYKLDEKYINYSLDELDFKILYKYVSFE